MGLRRAAAYPSAVPPPNARCKGEARRTCGLASDQELSPGYSEPPSGRRWGRVQAEYARLPSSLALVMHATISYRGPAGYSITAYLTLSERPHAKVRKRLVMGNSESMGSLKLVRLKHVNGGSSWCTEHFEVQLTWISYLINTYLSSLILSYQTCQCQPHQNFSS